MGKAFIKRFNVAINKAPVTRAKSNITKTIYNTQTLRGAAGADGTSGENVSVPDVIAGEVIAPYDLVYIENGIAFLASNDDVPNARKLAGFAQSGAPIGGQFPVITSGYLENPAWSWSTLSDLYLGLNGQATETPVPDNTGNFHVVVAESVSPTEIIVRIETPIVFS